MSYQQGKFTPRHLLAVALLVIAMVFISLGGPANVSADRPTDGPLVRQEGVTNGQADNKPEVVHDTVPGPLGQGAPVVEAPILTAEGRGEAVPGQYIVVMKNGLSRAASKAQIKDIVTKHGGQLVLSYESALHGYLVRMPEESVFALQRNRNVAFIEQDFVVAVADTQNGATWGLDRLDQRDLPLSNSYTYNTTASGVHAYIIDTGILLNHQEFAGRMGNGYDAVTSGGNANDCNGHGTHVAGTVGGSTYGVAKGVTLHPVRVLSCSGSGTNAGVIAGVDWVTANHVKPAVANMSLGGGASSALDTAVQNSINAGVTYAVAAGNDNANACNYSPARVGAAITVGSTTNTDARSSFSNYGSCLDIFAPGSSITSAWYTSNSATNTISGTSMASPHAAGVAALYLAANPNATPSQVRDALVNGGSAGKVGNAGSGSPNVLLYSLLTGSTPDPDPTPTPSPTPEPTPEPTPPPGGNTLTNGGFESGPNVGWSESGLYTIVTTNNPRTGSYSAWLGGYDNAVDQVYQKVTVPSGGTLSYYWQMQSSEAKNRVYDWMEVRLYDGNTGAYMTTLRRWTNKSTRDTWSQDTLNLSSYAGQSVYIVFHTDTDYSVSTSFFVDDVTLQ